MYEESKTWYCSKCKKNIPNCIDMDYHNNIEHPDFSNKYIKSWYNNGKKGLSPYD